MGILEADFVQILKYGTRQSQIQSLTILNGGLERDSNFRKVT